MNRWTWLHKPDLDNYHVYSPLIKLQGVWVPVLLTETENQKKKSEEHHKVNQHQIRHKWQKKILCSLICLLTMVKYQRKYPACFVCNLLDCSHGIKDRFALKGNSGPLSPETNALTIQGSSSAATTRVNTAEEKTVTPQKIRQFSKYFGNLLF